MDELRSLYESLVGGGYYSKSFEEFQKQFKDTSYQDKVYGVVTRDGLFSKSKDEFLKQYAVGPAKPINEPLKKKDPPILPESPEKYRRTDGESSSGVGSSALSGTDPNAPAPVDPLTTMYTSQFERSPIAAQDNTYVARQVDYAGRMEEWMREMQDLEVLREQSRQEQLAKAQEQEQVFKSQNLAANKDEDFQKYLGDVNANLISKKEEEVVPELNRRFGSYGFHFEEAKPGRDAMYVRTADGKHEMTIFLNLYKSATEVAESKRLRDFLQLHAQQPEREKSEDYIGKSLRAKSMRDAGRLNDDGTYSTVKFTSYEEDGKHYVIPTLFPKDPDSYTTDKKDWMELPFEEALNEARKRGEIFEFETDEEAKDFAEGDWKDVNAYDIEGQKFYKDRGLDYYAEQKKFKNYSKLQDELELIERIMDNEFITPQEKLDNPKYFSKDGTLLYFGQELKQEKDEVMKKKDNLLEQVFDIEFFGGDGPVQKAREDFDVVLEKRRNEIVGEAIKVNSAAKQEYDVLSETALKMYNVPIEKIGTIVPKTPRDAENIENLTRQLVKVRTAQQTAATNFEIAKTYYDAKWNKAANTEYEENWAGFSTAVSDAWKNGKAAEQILLLTLGMKDVENIEDREEVARLIVEYLSSVEGSQSRVLTRLNLSRDGEFSKSLLADPFETMLTFAASSFAQMAPYGLKIVPSATATGAAGGAALGSLGFAAGPAGFATTTGGAITGGGYGLRTGMAATMLAMEYTNSILDVMREKDYNLMDPKQVEAALMDETVWSEGSERGVRRGIPIAIVDYLSSGLAGRVFNTSRLASTPVRVGAMVAERAIFDPAAEAAGEYVAQEVAGQEIEWKEIAYEALGGLGNNTSMMAYNLYKETRNKTNTALAYELTDINRVANESVSDERISRWANNMHQLGKIDADVNQRIQENVGLRREAREITSVGRASRMLGEGRKVESRVMELLAAKKELTKSSNLKEIYRERISAIDQEIAVISETKKTLPGGPDVRGDGVTTAVNLDAILGTTREGVSNFKIGGKTLTRQQFLKELENMNDRRLLRARVNIENDEEVESLYEKKVKDAIQKQSTGEVSVQSETGVGEEMEGGTPKTELEVTTKEQERKQEEDLVSSKTRLDEIAEAIPERVDYTENDLVNFDTLEENKTRGVLAALAEKVAEGTKLSDVEQTVYDANKAQVDMFSDLAAERTAIQEEVSDLEAMLGRRAEFRAEEAVTPEVSEETQVEEVAVQEVATAPKLVRDISVLITPATVRSPSNLTKRIKALSIKYDKLVKQFSQKKDQKTLSKIKETEAQILNDAKQEIIDEVSKIKGVSVSFGSDKRGLWDGSFEPSFNMILSISTQADTEAVSKLLFDFSEKYSQDAFILETDSNYERDVTEGRREIPLTEFDDNKLMHYPQIVYTFDTPITDEQVADLSVALQENGIDAFSINNNEIKISVIKFFEEGSTLNENEQYEERTKDFKSKSIAAATATSNILGGDGNGSVSIRIKKSSYQGAKNERTTDQFRKYDRSDVLKPFQETVTDVELLSVELANLRKKQIQLQEKGKQLSKEEQERFDELQKNVQPTIQKTFEVNKAAYEEAKSEVEKIAEDAIEGTNASLSPFPIKRPERASVKAIRWYNSFTEKLGDGARVNIVVESEEDADKIFDLINKKYPTTKGDIDLRRLKEVTELGYPKRLIELRTSNGIIAEIQVITNEAYLAKDGISGFTGTEQQKNSAKKKLSEIRKRLGWSIPDGMGHYFYEIQRDVNVDEGLRSEALRLSNIYYDAFTNPESTIDESFMDEVIAFKNKVDLADKSNWDKGNEGKSPAPLIEYINQEGRAIEAAAPEINELLTADTKDKTTLEKVKDFLDKIDDDLTQFGNETAGMNIAIPVMKAIIKTVKALVSTGITLQEAIQRAASENNVTEQDVIDSINALAEQRDIQGKPQGVSEMELPGYNRMISELEGVIEKSRKRGNSEEKVMENAMAYLQGSKVYQDASDTQRERMVRDVRKVFGKREKAAPKPKKIFGEAKDVTMITMSEYDLLKKQLRDFGKGAKNAKMVWMRTSQALTKYLKEMVQKGFVSTKQVSAILRKFSAVNMFDEKSIERFVDYMEKVFKNADYAEQIAQVRAMLPRAKKNAQTKIGVAQTLSPLLNQLFAINPTLIPDAVFDKYLFVVSMMGERKTVLDLAESGKVTDMVEEVLNAVDEEVSMSEELAERFDAYEDKVVDEDGKIDYAETVKKMLKDDVITEEEASIMRKYKSNIMPMVAKEPMTEEEIAAEKAVLVGALKEISVDSDGLPMKDERNLARELAKLIKTDAVESLNITQLNNLLRVIGNINNGYLPHFAQLMVERLTAINNSKTLNTAVSEAKPLPLTTVYTKLKSLVTGKDKFVELIRRNPLFYIDQVFGNFKTKAIYNAIFERAAEAQAMFKRSVNELNNKLEAAEDAVAKSFKYNGNKTTMSKYKMMTFMVQLEYNSNPNNDTVNPAAKYLKKTIKHIRNGKTSFSERDANMLEDILDNFTDENGEIDNEKLYNSFNQAEKNAIKTVQDINAGMREKALYTAAVIRGDKIHPLNNYIHLNVLHEHRPDEAVSGVAFIDSYNNSLRSSTKAKSLIARTGKVAPINFDVFASANRGARYVLMDYYLTEPIRTARKTINETSSLLQEEKATRQQRDIFNAIDRAFEEAVDNLLISNFTDSSFGDKVVEFISKQGYRAVLASIPRFIGELSSNISFAIIAAPKDFKAGVGYRGVVLSADASRIMGNVGSKQTNRLFPHDTLSGRLVDTSILEQASGVKGSRAKNDVANKIQQIYNLSLKKYQNVVELMADSLLSLIHI